MTVAEPRLLRPTADPDHAISVDDLKRHVIVAGATGSGKTGLVVTLVEEALLAGISTVVIDVKGDLANLGLTSRSFDAADFGRWSPHGHADGAAAAEAWRGGIEAAGLEERYREFAGVQVDVYTPGSSAGRPIDVFSRLRPPTVDQAAHASRAAVTLLGLAGLDRDTLDPETVLVSSLILHAWEQDQPLDLPSLVGHIQSPSFSTIGAMAVDDFLPPAARMRVAMALNGLLASPSFATLMHGRPLDWSQLFPDGETRCAVFSVAHLGPRLRDTVVTRLLDAVRLDDGGTRVGLVVLDEAGEFIPSNGRPSTHEPILRCLHEGPGRGFGMVLAAGNPYEVDHRAFGSAATWYIGRLGMSRDVDRLAEVSGRSRADLAERVQGLTSRSFVCHRAGSGLADVRSRHALSYLAGPMTTRQLRARARPVSSGDSGNRPQAGDGSLPQRWSVGDWVLAFGEPATDGILRPAIVVTARVRWDRDIADLDLVEKVDYVVYPALEGWPHAINRVGPIEVTPPSEGVTRTDAPSAEDVDGALRTVRDVIAARTSMILAKCADLQLWARPGEALDDFENRCRSAALQAAALEEAELRSQLEQRGASTSRRLLELPDDPEVDEIRAALESAIAGIETELDDFDGLVDEIEQDWLARSHAIEHVVLTPDPDHAVELTPWILWVPLSG